MKTVLFCSILFCAIAMPALGELTDADLDKIRLIVNEEIKPIEADIVLLKTDTAWIRGKLESVDEQFEGVNNQITHSRRITYGLIALIVAAVGIPQIVIVKAIIEYKSSDKPKIQHVELPKYEEVHPKEDSENS